MPQTTIVEITPAEQARRLAELRRARYGYLLAVPLLLLYEISVWIAWYWERQEKKRELEA